MYKIMDFEYFKKKVKKHKFVNKSYKINKYISVAIINL
jgi:hypothetical protein